MKNMYRIWIVFVTVICLFLATSANAFEKTAIYNLKAIEGDECQNVLISICDSKDQIVRKGWPIQCTGKDPLKLSESIDVKLVWGGGYLVSWCGPTYPICSGRLTTHNFQHGTSRTICTSQTSDLRYTAKKTASTATQDTWDITFTLVFRSGAEAF